MKVFPRAVPAKSFKAKMYQAKTGFPWKSIESPMCLIRTRVQKFLLLDLFWSLVSFWNICGPSAMLFVILLSYRASWREAVRGKNLTVGDAHRAKEHSIPSEPWLLDVVPFIPYRFEFSMHFVRLHKQGPRSWHIKLSCDTVSIHRIVYAGLGRARHECKRLSGHCICTCFVSTRSVGRSGYFGPY